jgi:hypothetical protein
LPNPSSGGLVYNASWDERRLCEAAQCTEASALGHSFFRPRHSVAADDQQHLIWPQPRPWCCSIDHGVTQKATWEALSSSLHRNGNEARKASGLVTCPRPQSSTRARTAFLLPAQGSFQCRAMAFHGTMALLSHRHRIASGSSQSESEPGPK